MGTNFAQLPINRPKYSFNPLRRDGGSCLSQGGPNTRVPPYYPSSRYSLDASPPRYASNVGVETWNGRVVDYESKMEDGDLEQPRDFWERILAKEPGQQQNLVSNIAEHLAEAEASVREKAYGMLTDWKASDLCDCKARLTDRISTAMFSRVHPDLGRGIRRATEREAADLALKKANEKLDNLTLPFQPRTKRTALDKNEDLPCSLEPCLPNAGLVSGKTATKTSLFDY